jgi:hypothetical protein
MLWTLKLPTHLQEFGQIGFTVSRSQIHETFTQNLIAFHPGILEILAHVGVLLRGLHQYDALMNILVIEVDSSAVVVKDQLECMISKGSAC